MSEKPRIRVRAGSSVMMMPNDRAVIGGNQPPADMRLKQEHRARNEYDGGRQRRRLSSWQPTKETINSILSASGELLRARCRDTLRNNPHANAASDSFVANLVGAGIKPSSLLKDYAELRAAVQELWLDFTDECDADGLSDFYGMQATIARSLFEAGECFVRFRPRRLEDGYSVPLQIQLLESEMCPYHYNQTAPNGNEIMNGIELDFVGDRVAYWFYRQHPGDVAIEQGFVGTPVRVPASEVLHIFQIKRPGQMRGVPMVTPALLKLFLLDQYDDAELERKKIAAMFAAFITSPSPEDVVPVDGMDEDAPADNVGLTGLEPGTIQTLLPGEEVQFSEPADVGGSYELFQYRQQLAVFAAMGVPYTIGTGDLKRANYSSLRGAIVEYRRKLEQIQHNVIVQMFCAPVWRRWMNDAVLAGALEMPADYVVKARRYQRCKWIPPRFDWVDPLKDRQAEKLAVDAGFKSRSDVVEAEGSDPEENDARIAADMEREKKLGLKFLVTAAATTQPGDDTAAEAAETALDDAEDGAASSNSNSQAA